jgi:hypothetical protein
MTRESSHDTVYELLPWYANQTLPTEECALVEQHVARCTHCMQELQHLYDIGAAMKEADVAAPPVNASLERTLSAIDNWDTNRRPGIWHRLISWFHALWTPSIPMARVVFAAQLAIIFAFAALLIVPRLTEKSFNTLSGKGAAGNGGPLLNVIFEPNTTEQTIRQSLVDSGATIVSGPSALGVYVVELSGRKDNDPDVETQILKLRNKTGVVRFVERQP